MAVELVMRKYPIPLFLLVAFLGCDRWESVEGVVPVPKRRPVDSVQYVDSSGISHALAEHRGKVVVVDVWATWCPPCRRSLPEIAALQDKEGTAFQVLAISVDRRGWDDVRPFLGANPSLGLRAALPKDPDSLNAFGEIHSIPTTLIVDRQGRLRERWSGYYPGRAEGALQEALKEP
jgi:thiol-disulfide isomerase/thioredoxin